MLIFLPRGLSNLIAQSDQLAPLLIQMSGVRLEQRKQDLIGHGEAMLKAIHLAPARISYEIRETTYQTHNASRFKRCWETAEWKTGCVALASQFLMFLPWNRPSRLNLPMEFWNHLLQRFAFPPA
jgi:hypothetical protein